MSLIKDNNYDSWLKQIKEQVRLVQIKAAVKVNSELLQFYWELGADIVDKQKNTTWGSGFLKQLSKDLSDEFPDIKGFSKRNLELIRKWFTFWQSGVLIKEQAVDQLETSFAKQLVSQTENKDNQKVKAGSPIAQQAASQLTSIPWGHNIVIVTKCKKHDEALFYVLKTIENGWSRSVLTHQIESNLFERSGKAITNFDATLPAPHSDLAKETLKSSYTFDFLTLTEKYNERELEKELVNHITKFLLELGTGFSFIAKEYKLDIADDEFYIDLLFYHVKLHSFIVVELKTKKFKPEFAGQLNFYVSAVDEIVKTEDDKPTIGILICKSKNDTVVEYALKSINKPIGVSEYTITKNLPENLKSALPSIEEIEAELSKKITYNDVKGGSDE